MNKQEIVEILQSKDISTDVFKVLEFNKENISRIICLYTTKDNNWQFIGTPLPISKMANLLGELEIIKSCLLDELKEAHEER